MKIFTCDILDGGSWVLLKYFQIESHFSCGFDVCLSGKNTHGRRERLQSQRQIDEISRRLWLVEIGRDQRCWPITRRNEIVHNCGENPINPRHRLTHDKLRLRHNFLIITSQGAHVRLHAEVFGASLPSAVRPSDEYMTSHGYDGIHVMIKHYDDDVLTSQLSVWRSATTKWAS